jgi:hypothetical protein
MEPIGYLYDLVSKSDISVLGYTYKSERIKDEFISRLPHLNVGDVDSSFNFIQYLREIKLTQVLGDYPEFRYVVLDIGSIRLSSDVDGMAFSKVIRKMIQQIRTDMYKAYNKMQEESLGLDFDDPESHKEEVIETPYQLIITAPMYKSSSEFKIHNFTGGDSTIYMADLAFVIQDSNITDKLLGKKPYISIMKNRYGMGGTENVSLEEILLPLERNNKIEKVLS